MQSTLAPGRAESIADAAEQHRGELLAYLGRMLGDAFEAEDALQDTLLRALQSPATPPPAELRPWLYRIATNRAIDLLRRRRRQVAMAGETEAPQQTDRTVEHRMTLAVVRRLVEAMPHKQRVALVLRRYHGLSYGEIGRALGCSETAARANAYQALRRLRAHFSQEERL